MGGNGDHTKSLVSGFGLLPRVVSAVEDEWIVGYSGVCEEKSRK